MKVYLASWFQSLPEMRQRAEELRTNGIEVTSRWLEERVKPTTQINDVSEEYLRDTAMVDIHDILLANVVVLNVPSAEQLKDPTMPIASWARGGRHFEAGFQYATMVFYNFLPWSVNNRGTRQLILVGHKENVFHYLDDLKLNGRAFGFELPVVPCFDTWEDAKQYLFHQQKLENSRLVSKEEYLWPKSNQAGQ